MISLNKLTFQKGTTGDHVQLIKRCPMTILRHTENIYMHTTDSKRTLIRQRHSFIADPLCKSGHCVEDHEECEGTSCLPFEVAVEIMGLISL